MTTKELADEFGVSPTEIRVLLHNLNALSPNENTLHDVYDRENGNIWVSDEQAEKVKQYYVDLSVQDCRRAIEAFLVLLDYFGIKIW